MDLKVAGKYCLTKKIGSGSFGEIYKGVDITNNAEVAIKLEPVNSRHPQLLYETKIYKLMQGAPGIPNVHWYGWTGEYVAMVMDLLGPSLEDLFNLVKKKFSVKTVLMMADQMIQRIEYFHSQSFLHRDVKPDNFLIGLGKNQHLIYIIDYGLAKRYTNPITNEHIAYRDNKNLTGTARYASVNTHFGIEQSRRDDLEGIGYVLMYFLRGSLPWQGLRASNRKKRYKYIRDVKSQTTVETLCKGFPTEFATYITYCKGLHFDQRPDYDYLKKMFRDSFNRLAYRWDYMYDWLLPNNDTRSVQSTETSQTLIEETKANVKEKEEEKKVLPAVEEVKVGQKRLSPESPCAGHNRPESKMVKVAEKDNAQQIETQLTDSLLVANNTEFQKPVLEVNKG